MPVLRVGRHSHEVIDPDTTHCKFVGEITVSEITEILRYQAAWAKNKAYILGIFDLAEAVIPNSAVRKTAAEFAATMPIRGTVLFGASFQIRITANLLFGAIAMLSKSDAPHVFVETEADAQTWIVKRRAVLKQELTHSSAH